MQRICGNSGCKIPFEITDDDLEFYDKVSPIFDGKKYSIPPPTQCPECRFQRRMIWRREHALKHRTCSLCHRSIVSIHTADAPYPVYCLKCWWGDSWDAHAYGKDFGPSRSFNEQFADLLQLVPQIAMMNDNGIGSENCEYCQDFAFGKNCYLVTGAWEIQDCCYCDSNCLQSKFLVDCYGVHMSELAYESLTSQHLYRCTFMNHCENCHDCHFGVDLKGCHHCIGCIGLRHREFCIFNEQYSKEEYEAKSASLALETYEGFLGMQGTFGQWIVQFPRKCVHLVNCEECIGDNLFNCKNVSYGFQFNGAAHCKFIIHGDAPKNSYDVSQTGRPEWCYEGATPDNSYMTHFTTWCWKDKYVLCSDNCHSCNYLFGCIGMKHQKYCILNKQYTKEDYEDLVPKIIDRMRSDGEWGEFRPMRMSPYCYNETHAAEAKPLSREQVVALGLKWRDQSAPLQASQAYSVPSRIQDVQDDILQQELACEECKRRFKVVPQELSFYRDMQIPIPHLCYECRYRKRLLRCNPRKLWPRQCAKCGKEIQTTYSPERPEIVYCEDCYLKEVY